jgi:hypothetical protein
VVSVESMVVLVIVLTLWGLSIAAVVSAVLQPRRRWEAIDRSKGGWVFVTLVVPFGWAVYLVSIRPKLVAASRSLGTGDSSDGQDGFVSGGTSALPWSRKSTGVCETPGCRDRYCSLSPNWSVIPI